MLMKNICPISSPVGINGWELRPRGYPVPEKGGQRRISGIGSLPDRGKRSGGIHTADGGFPHRFPEKLVNRWDAKVMLVPTADNILTDKLPAFAPCYDETRLLAKVKESVGEEHYIDVYSALQEHAGEPIYYRTDHHWTSLGAYYGFLAWADSMGKFPYPYNTAGMKTVSEDFQGTLQSRINVAWTKDRIQYFPETEKKPVTVTYDFADTADSLYAPEYLKTKNQYGFFLNDNHAFIEIHTGYNAGKTLFVIKDSYANSMIPLLTAHYETIYVVDLRYFNGKLFQFMEQYEPEQGMDVLVLYDCIHFLEDFKFY